MTQHSKKIQAINGDAVNLSHPAVDLSGPMSSFISIASGATVHQAVTRPTAMGVDFTTALATLTVGGGQLDVIPAVDNNETGAALPRFDAVWQGQTGVVMIGAYGTVQAAVDLVASLGITATPLGARLTPTGSTRFVSYPTVVIEAPGLGLLEIVPLTTEVMAQLPDWAGTSTTGGDLYAGSLSRSTGYLTLVSETARTHVMVRADGDLDSATELTAGLQVSWQA